MDPVVPPDRLPLEVEHVEWIPLDAHLLRVDLLGRWFERPAPGAALLLVAEGESRKGFAAVEHPPIGTLLAFEVPVELRAALEGDIALQLGSAEVPLPSAIAGSLERDQQAEGEVIDHAVLAERRAARRAEAGDELTRRAEAAEQTATTLSAHLANLEQRLRLVREERADLESRLAEAERRAQSAGQRQRAEQMRRAEALDDLALVRRAHDSEIADLREELRVATRRGEALARDVERARAASDTSETRAALAALRERADELATALTHERAERERAASAVIESPQETAALRGVLAERTAELEQTKIDLRRASAAALQDDRRAHELAEAWKTVETVQREAAELQRRVDAERGERIAQAAAVRTHVEELRERLVGVVAGMRDALDVERTARVSAEEQLAAERRKGDAARAEAAGLAIELDAERARSSALDLQIVEIQQMLRVQAEQAQAERDARERREVHLQSLVAEVLRTSASLRTRFEVEIRELERQLGARMDGERREAEARIAASEEQIAGLEARIVAADAARERQARELDLKAHAESLRAELTRVRAESKAQAAGTRPGEELIGGLDAAAERLRAQAVEAPEDDELVEEAPEKPSVPEAEVAAPAPAPKPSPAPEQPAPAAGGSSTLAPLKLVRREPPAAWLAPAIRRLADQDEELAARLVIELLPVGRSERPMTYDATIEGFGTQRVQRTPNGTTIEARERPGRGSDARLVGGPAAFAELAAGGLSAKRPAGLRVSGRRWRVRRLLRELGRPLSLADVRAAEVQLHAGALLAALCVAIDPAWTAGRDCSVVWRIAGDDGGIWRVEVRDGVRPTVTEGMPEEPPTAVVYVAEGALMPLLGAGGRIDTDAAKVTGDGAAVELLRGWLHRAQGII